MLMHTQRRPGVWVLTIIVVGVVSAGCRTPASRPVAADAPLGGLQWMSGAWVRVDGSTRSEELWTAPAGGSMFGINRTIVQGRTAFFEYLRIEHHPDGIHYLASPGGEVPATVFTLVEQGGKQVVFENKAHDYPQRIVYWLADDDTLCARIEGEQGGQARTSEWCWQRTAGP